MREKKTMIPGGDISKISWDIPRSPNTHHSHKRTRTINKQLQTDETSSWRALRYSEETRETWWAKTNDGPLEEHRKHLPALPLPQSRAAQHQEGSHRFAFDKNSTSIYD